jgi:spermidine/putrescine transport system permease protein
VSAPAIPVSGAQATRGRSPKAIDRWDGFVERYFRLHTGLVYLFLYLPIVVVIVFAFNATDTRVTLWRGFSPKWFGIALTDPLVQKYVANSFIVAVPNAIFATLFGTMAALGLQRVGKRMRLAFDALTYVSVIVPEIVIALATLVLFATSFDAIEAFFGGTRPGFGYHTIIAAHMLFNISLVLLLVRARLSTMDRTHVEASYDLFAPPWPTFLQITLPQLLPAIMAGFLLSFTFSFDDYVITTFTSGPGSTTLPLYIFGAIKKGVTPETNAVATMMLAFTLAMLAVGQFILSRSSRRRGEVTSMAGIISEQA